MTDTANAIWVLVANSQDASICRTHEGSSALVREMRATGGRDFAFDLMSELSRGAQARSYDGVILMAEPDMLDALRSVAVPSVRNLLIAEIAYAPMTETVQ